MSIKRPLFATCSIFRATAKRLSMRACSNRHPRSEPSSPRFTQSRVSLNRTTPLSLMVARTILIDLSTHTSKAVVPAKSRNLQLDLRTTRWISACVRPFSILFVPLDLVRCSTRSRVFHGVLSAIITSRPSPSCPFPWRIKRHLLSFIDD